jgi:ParB family chromosome partitioning protein
MGHARALLALNTTVEQLKLRDEILAHDWSVRATEDSIRAAETAPAPRRTPRRRRGHSAELAALEQSLQRSLMTRVVISGNEHRGKIEIAYATAEELERITELLGVSR